MTRLLACAFGPGRGLPAALSQDILATVAAEGWTPPGCRLALATAPARWWEGLHDLERAIAEHAAEAVLLLAVDPYLAEPAAARGARNQADAEPDEAGRCWPGRALSPGGPRWRKATVPGEALCAAITAAGLPARASPDAGGYVANRSLFALLGRSDAPAAGCLRLPIALETARKLARPTPARLNRAEILSAVKAALNAAAAGVRAASAAAAPPIGAP